MEDTIAAIATSPGESSIGIVRISGTEAINLVEQIFKPRNEEKWQRKISHQLYLGYIVDTFANCRIIDEVLVSIMKAPHSFTGEDVVEVNCHGGYLPLKSTLELLLRLGARLAEPGEFSKRAFLNGRLDLAQAEAIIDIIRATSKNGLALAVEQLEGKLSRQVEELRRELLRILAFLEASIDFPEDEIEGLSTEELKNAISNVQQRVQILLDSYEAGKIYREGLKTVIIGKPNVGKSSLLNALVKEQRAIVTDIPGTTRDVIEERVLFGGIALNIMDTAGIREAKDLVEKIGVERSLALLKEADLILLVLDATQKLTVEDKQILEIVKDAGKRHLILLNKIDIAELGEMEYNFGDTPVLEISAKEELGFDRLEQAVKELFYKGQLRGSNEQLITKLRHYEALQKAAQHLQEAMHGLEAEMSADFLTIDLKGAWEALGTITGSTVAEDIIDRIFADFCIGK